MPDKLWIKFYAISVLPQARLRKRPSRAGFQVILKFAGFLLVAKSVVGDKVPRFVFSRMDGTTRIMRFNARF